MCCIISHKFCAGALKMCLKWVDIAKFGWKTYESAPTLDSQRLQTSDIIKPKLSVSKQWHGAKDVSKVKLSLLNHFTGMIESICPNSVFVCLMFDCF